jgi:4-amino-4-deoxy-L-arabinose transferase-like glycosyltransferase
VSAAGARARPRLPERLLVPALGLAAATSFLWNLGGRALENWDEAIYAQIAREMLQGEGWITPHWNYAPWFLKPPLLVWLQAGLFHLFGVGELWARLPSAAAGVVLVLTSFAIGKRLYGPWVGALAGVILLSGYHLAREARFGTTDVLLTAFIYLAVLAYLRSRAQPRWWVGAGACVGLAIMTKGAGALLAPVAIVIAMALDRRLRDLGRPGPWLGVAAALAIALPWHWVMLARGGATFVSQYFGREVLARATEPIELHAGGPAFYLLVLRNSFFPWAYLVPFALVPAALRARRGDTSIVLVLPLLVLGVYTLVGTKLNWYLIPAYPGLAVLIAALIVEAGRHWPVRDRLTPELYARSAICIAVIAAVFSVPHVFPHYPEVFVAALVVLLALAVAIARVRGWHVYTAMLAMMVGFCVATGFSYVWPLYAGVRDPIVAVASAARLGQPSPDPPLLVYPGASSQIPVPVWPQALFYSDRRLQTAPGPDTLRAALRAAAAGGDGELLLLAADRDAVAAAVDLQVVTAEDRYLYARIRPKS